MTFRSFLFTAAIAGTLTAGCAKKPTMRLNHAEVSGVSFGFPPSVGVVMTVVVDVYNPNSYDVAIRAMRGTVVLADLYTLPVDFQPGGEGVWLTADQTTAVRVPVTVPADLAARMLQQSAMSPTIPYRLVGRADVTATRSLQIEKDNYEVDERGTISREQVDAAVRSVFFPMGR